MNAAVNRLCLMTACVAIVGATTPSYAQYFSSTGRSGYSSEYFIDKIEESGIEKNKVVTVVRSANDIHREQKEYLVNCNASMPQVVDDRDHSTRINLRRDPSSAEKLEWELWFAACKKDYAKISKRSPVQGKLSKLNNIKSFDFDGLIYSLKYHPVNYSKTLSNLVSANFDRVDGLRNNPLLIYCNADNPTVHWVEFKQLVGVDDPTGLDLNKGLEKRLISLSKEIWSKTCEQEKYAQPAKTDQPIVEGSFGRKEPKQSASASISASALEANSLKEIYKGYIITKEACQLGYSADFKTRPLKDKLKSLDVLSKEHGIDVDSVWVDAVKLMEKDTNYQLAQLYKTMPMQTSDRIHFSQSCEQLMPILEVSIATHMQKFGGVSNKMEKDF